ncbi:LacI family DNA-binding transcriptional regulator [Bacillota bacterium Meth-B3]|nr:LacI family DNA-binding transcriptional regulator [Christensenellaceae bacterium]
MNAVKLEDIAKKLGLSISTVSRALSGNGRVGEKTRRRVLEAVKESDYTVNAVARSLRLRDAKNIGILVPDITNSFFASVIKGAQGACRENSYTLMVCNSDESPEIEEESLRTLLEKQVSGLILATVSNRPEGVLPYRRLNTPVVFIDNLPSESHAADFVSIDNRAAAYRLTREVLARGYRRIGMITGPLTQSSGRLRLRGYKDALKEAGVAPEKNWVVEGDFRFASGYAHMRAVLLREDRPEAMLIANNYMTYGALNAVREMGLEVPRDIAVAAFDAEDHSGLIVPLISCINQPAFEIGFQSAQIILRKLSGKTEPTQTHHIVLEPTLSDGNSW